MLARLCSDRRKAVVVVVIVVKHFLRVILARRTRMPVLILTALAKVVNRQAPVSVPERG